MSDLISRSALVENIKRAYCADCNSHNGVLCRACWTADVLDMVEGAPAVEDMPPRMRSTDLSGKCGSCRWAVKDVEHFGYSQSCIQCTNPEKETRFYYGRPVSGIKQRTAKACKKYEEAET